MGAKLPLTVVLLYVASVTVACELCQSLPHTEGCFYLTGCFNSLSTPQPPTHPPPINKPIHDIAEINKLTEYSSSL